MPKKFKGENSKAAEARARKEAKNEEERLKKEQEAEDEFWRDDDKQVVKKQQRKEEKEKKRLEQLERKKELQKLHDEEMEQLKSKRSASQNDKMTRAEISANLERQRLEEEQARKKKEKESHLEVDLDENINRVVTEGDEARTVEDAISVLSVQSPSVDKNPEKRLKAAYKAFEDANLPNLKQENPNLRLSQLKQMLRKDWMKSADNPLNQRIQE
ncbi:hypothetical protein CHS0354_012450 [Potamilus streckersoni]|uniref:Coiled-coil domain-containing protein n=1 Tax=Potamilus streckersoni TaxID=2493646 RepID=A0AAE0RUL2_9BIVA|nr:hypothetical protein CHS0354_012450 [Potamilus streckersoni]